MTGIDFRSAELVYRKARQATVVRHLVRCPQLAIFTRAFRDLEAKLGDSRADGYWRETRRWLWWFWSGATGTPLRYNDESIAPSDRLDVTLERLGGSASAYPGVHGVAREVRERLTELVALENPLLAAIETASSNATGQVAVLIREARLIPAVEVLFRERGLPARVVSSAELAGSECHDQLLIIGATRWFPHGVLLSPRASSIQVLTPDFIRDTWPGTPVFAGCIDGGLSQVVSKIPLAPKSELAPPEALVERLTEPLPEPPVEPLVDALEFLQSVDWEAVAVREVDTGQIDEFEEVAQARMVLLEGGHAVLLDASDGAKVLVLDLRELGGAKGVEAAVMRSRVDQLEPGMFLLVRTSGGGEAIPEVADRLLGQLAPAVRASQQAWKGALRGIGRRMGLFETSLELIDRGSLLANETNLRNWMGDRNLRPRNPKDFRAILRLVEMEERFDEYWKNARIIDAAHRRAGFVIRKLLIQQVARADLARLVKLGTLDLELGEEGGGVLTAFRVAEVPSRVYLLPAAKLGSLLDAGDEHWHG